MKFNNNGHFVFTSMIVLASCTTPGLDERPDTYAGSQANQRQAIKVVNIISISPVRMKVDNSANKRTAQIAGGIIGAGLGAGLGFGVGHSGVAGTFGGLGGGVAGALAGSAVPGTTYVDGVTIAFKEGNQAYSSTQVGRLCEYGIGQATMVSTTATETRIQPNRQCPKK